MTTSRHRKGTGSNQYVTRRGSSGSRTRASSRGASEALDVRYVGFDGASLRFGGESTEWDEDPDLAEATRAFGGGAKTHLARMLSAARANGMIVTSDHLREAVAALNEHPADRWATADLYNIRALSLLAYERDQDVRLMAFANLLALPDTPSWVHRAGAVDSSYAVRELVARSQGTPVDVQRMLLGDERGEVWQSAASAFPRAHADQLAEDHGAPVEVRSRLIDRSNRVSDAALSRLVGDPDPQIRAAVAASGRCPDDDPSVASAAFDSAPHGASPRREVSVRKAAVSSE